MTWAAEEGQEESDEAEGYSLAFQHRHDARSMRTWVQAAGGGGILHHRRPALSYVFNLAYCNSFCRWVSGIGLLVAKLAARESTIYLYKRT